ncbi:MAG: bifunctional hydroxymethylpyrimidine kinase/phosphomethylpyrimidine kinase [Bacteroidia bacterium]
MRRALTIAGSDSCGGAGIAADLQTFAVLGVHGMCALSALTAQNTYHVKSIHIPPGKFLYAQLEAIWQDMPPHAFKTGMLGERKVLQALVKFFRQVSNLPPWVLDPVMIATSGAVLLQEKAIQFLWDHLIPQATVITPNLPEAAHLAQLPVPSTEKEFYHLGETLSRQMQGVFWLLKGGHASWQKDHVVDALFHEGMLVCQWKRKRLFFTQPIHGSGCTLSAAVCAFLAMGLPVQEALTKALDFLHQALETSDPDLAHAARIPNRSYLCRGTYTS